MKRVGLSSFIETSRNLPDFLIPIAYPAPFTGGGSRGFSGLAADAGPKRGACVALQKGLVSSWVRLERADATVASR